MDFLSNILAIFVLLTILLLYIILKKSSHSRKKTGRLPPEASGSWPIIGHLHLLGGQITASRTLAALADKYGPVFTIRLGLHSAVVVSSWESVKECFTTNDRVFAKRPFSSAGKYLGFDYAAFGFSEGPYWREMRKLLMQELISTQRLEMLKHVRMSEINTSIKELYMGIKENPGRVVILSQWIEQLTLNIIVMKIAGKRYADSTHGAETAEARSFRKVVKEFNFLAGQFVLSDAIPSPLLRWLDFQGHIKSMKRVSRELSSIAESWIDEHIERNQIGGIKNEQEIRDFIDVMLSEVDKYENYGRTPESIIMGTVTNLILAGSDTTAILLTWVLSLLLNNRHIMNRAQEEIDTKVGKKRWVEESDIKNLVYLQAIVKETLRLYPPGPLSVPHEALEDCYVSGYWIPKGTRLLTNIWKLHRDPSVWSDPDKFIPERFLTNHAEVDVRGQHFEFIPFGSGRRCCPGITFAMQVAHLTLARLLQGFDFTTPSDAPVDMIEGQGITLPKANPLEVFMKKRLPDVLYHN